MDAVKKTYTVGWRVMWKTDYSRQEAEGRIYEEMTNRGYEGEWNSPSKT